MHLNIQRESLFNLAKLTKYGAPNSYDLAKCMAIIAMLIDHLGLFFFPDHAILSIIGRISFPIFFFLIGYSQKFKNEKSILILALFMLVLDHILADKATIFFLNSSSILPTIIISRFFLNRSITLIKNNLLISFFLLALYYIPIAVIFGYGTLGCMFMICGYLKRNNHRDLNSLIFLALTTMFYIILQGHTYHFWGIMIFTVEMLILLSWIYNFKINNYLITNHCLNSLILLCSRYSIYLYCVHFELFKIINMVI
jgi:hypothetical protein